MVYEITYRESTEGFQNFMDATQNQFLAKAKMNPAYKYAVANAWLGDCDDSQLEEAERLNMILPVIKWSVEYGMMTDILEDELYLYYEDYTNGKLDDILADYEAKEIIADLVWCYRTHFSKK